MNGARSLSFVACSWMQRLRGSDFYFPPAPHTVRRYLNYGTEY